MSHIVIDARIIRSSTGRYVERLLEYLQNIDSVNHYSILLRPEDRSYWQPKSPNFEIVEAPFADFSFGEQMGLYRLLKRLKPDLVHFVMPQYPVLYRGKFVSTIHDLTMFEYTHRQWYEILYTFKRAVFKRVFASAVKKSSHIIVPTNHTKDRLLEKFPVSAKKITVTYEAADKLAAGKPEPIKSLAGQDFIMYVGQAAPYKNLERLVLAYQITSPTQLKLVIVGKETDWHKRLRDLVTSRNIKGVLFTGFITDEQLAWLYSRAKAYVFPSLNEGFGLPGLEAMLYGCPVIAAGNSCLPEVYGDAALYFDPFSIEDMAEVINRVVSDPELRQKMQIAGKKQAGKYSWSRMAEQTLSVYKKASGSSGSSDH